MLIRMTHHLRIRLAQFLGVVLALAAGSAVAAEHGQQPKVAYVLAGPAATQPDTIARATAEAASAHAQLRIVRTTNEELGTLHVLAARGYDTVITLGVDQRIAIDPVAARYPHTRFVPRTGA